MSAYNAVGLVVKSTVVVNGNGNSASIDTRVAMTLPAGTNLQAFRFVTTNAQSEVIYANSTNVGAPATYNVLGIILTSVNAESLVDIIDRGEVSNPGWNFTPGMPIFLGADGVPSETPDSIVYKLLGYAISATKIAINMQQGILLVANF